MGGWISSEERLPEEGVTVLVEGGVARRKPGFWVSGMVEPLWMQPIKSEVTHWMPLPVPPKPVDEGEGLADEYVEGRNIRHSGYEVAVYNAFLAGYAAGLNNRRLG